jgi:hypothetical protein
MRRAEGVRFDDSRNHYQLSFIWCGARSNGDGQCWLGDGSLFPAQVWGELPGTEDQIDAGRALPALNAVGDPSGSRG